MTQSNDQKPMQRLHASARTLALAGVLATTATACGQSVPEQPPTEAPTTEAAPVFIGEVPHERIAISLLVNDERYAFYPSPVDLNNTAQVDAHRKKLDTLLAHPEHVTSIGIEIKDTEGKAAPCINSLTLLPSERTDQSIRKGLMALARSNGKVMSICDLNTLDRWIERNPSAQKPTVPVTPEPIDPNTIASRERSHHGRIERNGLGINA